MLQSRYGDTPFVELADPHCSSLLFINSPAVLYRSSDNEGPADERLDCGNFAVRYFLLTTKCLKVIYRMSYNYWHLLREYIDSYIAANQFMRCSKKYFIPLSITTIIITLLIVTIF